MDAGEVGGVEASGSGEGMCLHRSRGRCMRIVPPSSLRCTTSMNSATGTCPHREDDAQQQDVPKCSASTGSRGAHHSKAG